MIIVSSKAWVWLFSGIGVSALVLASACSEEEAANGCDKFYDTLKGCNMLSDGTLPSSCDEGAECFGNCMAGNSCEQLSAEFCTELATTVMPTAFASCAMACAPPPSTATAAPSAAPTPTMTAAPAAPECDPFDVPPAAGCAMLQCTSPSATTTAPAPSASGTL